MIVDVGDGVGSSDSVGSDKPRVRIQAAPTGTTWVFDDGTEQVVHTKATQQSNDDFLAEFDDEIAEEKSHNRGASAASTTPQSNQDFLDDLETELTSEI